MSIFWVYEHLTEPKKVMKQILFDFSVAADVYGHTKTHLSLCGEWRSFFSSPSSPTGYAV